MFIQLVLAAAIALAVTTGCRPSPVQREPGLNVLLITIDTLRADALGAYGNTTVSTPLLDRLSAGGVRFSRALAQTVVTLPSHANILSGRYPFAHSVRENYLSGTAAPKSSYTEADDPKRLVALDREIDDVITRYQAGDFRGPIALGEKIVSQRPTWRYR